MIKKIVMTLILFASMSGLLKAENPNWTNYHMYNNDGNKGLVELQNLRAPDSLAAVSKAAEVRESFSNAYVYANRLNRKDLAAWAANNKFYTDIVLFKCLTNYKIRTTDIDSLNPKSPERLSKVKDLQIIEAQYLSLLEESLKEIKSETIDPSDKKLFLKLESNLNFVSDVREFVARKFK